ncbi:PD-(D/E)XK nuclease family protein [Hymenobacter psychrotolerans]|uniref:PD-(D/E)XK nuclease superfamily protein n=1 Tax=Hymenobacter psychrotolerans DSM 18569 TaxID=1121959 RepID=A0A1M6UPJ1_9BACT|nr:PD-(D/E)XK nuclease family protein [Hymenobacter psychrotolerans]SHK71086.1 PD-(D/E)XK nuclease superfamily protein [Hymenobacter psychrotolerans DSM 18569]
MIKRTAAQIKADLLKRDQEIREQMRLLALEQEASELELLILERFERNYETLALESGRRISPDVKEAALKQVLMYWRKLPEVATTVTQTEVRLSLPNQRTSTGTVFTIEGVVDIIRDNDRTVMYDIKTHDIDSVVSNIELYQQQLNVYAHIWQTLRQQELHETCIIATAFPKAVRDAVTTGDDAKIDAALASWNPALTIPFDQQTLEQTIIQFTQTVEAIEGGQFAPPPVSRLQERVPGSRTLYATRICINCDSRFSCNAYRAYAEGDQTTAADEFGFYNDYGTAIDQSEWLSTNLSIAPPADIDDLI